jgi:hypothetical protein
MWNYNYFRPEQMLNIDMKKNEKYKSYIEKLLPEPQPNSEPLLIGLPSATLIQNALLCKQYLPLFRILFGFLSAKTELEKK